MSGAERGRDGAGSGRNDLIVPEAPEADFTFVRKKRGPAALAAE
jgi:hypothetical protein